MFFFIFLFLDIRYINLKCCIGITFDGEYFHVEYVAITCHLMALQHLECWTSIWIVYRRTYLKCHTKRSTRYRKSKTRDERTSILQKVLNRRVRCTICRFSFFQELLQHQKSGETHNRKLNFYGMVDQEWEQISKKLSIKTAITECIAMF